MLINQKKLEEFSRQKQREIEELKAFIDQSLKKQKLEQIQYQDILKSKVKTEKQI